jgi:hypothetical protein
MAVRTEGIERVKTILFHPLTSAAGLIKASPNHTETVNGS